MIAALIASTFRVGQAVIRFRRERSRATPERRTSEARSTRKRFVAPSPCICKKICHTFA